MQDLPIGVFDSGLGGLTVMAEIIKRLPNEKIIYLGDTARFPYGPRPREELRGFVFEIIEYLLGLGVKLIVVACNSSSAAALDAAQERFDIPILGVVEPGARAAVLATRTRRIGVIGTKATIESGAYQRAIETFDAGAEVYARASHELANFVERGEVEGPAVERAIREYVTPLIDAGIDTLIMGCTHYPLLSRALQNVVGPQVRLISSAEETAAELEEILRRKEMLRPGGPGECRFLCTADDKKFLELGSVFFGGQICDVELVPVSVLSQGPGKVGVEG